MLHLSLCLFNYLDYSWTYISMCNIYYVKIENHCRYGRNKNILFHVVYSFLFISEYVVWGVSTQNTINWIDYLFYGENYIKSQIYYCTLTLTTYLIFRIIQVYRDRVYASYQLDKNVSLFFVDFFFSLPRPIIIRYNTICYA